MVTAPTVIAIQVRRTQSNLLNSRKLLTNSLDRYLVSEKTSSSRKGTLVSVINHYAPNPSTDEPKLSDYYSQNQTSQSRRKRSA